MLNGRPTASAAVATNSSQRGKPSQAHAARRGARKPLRPGFGPAAATTADAADSQRSLLKIVAASRTSGRLNLSSHGLAALPDAVWGGPLAEDGQSNDVLLDRPAPGSDGGAWWETVDLARLVAADNQLESIDPRIAQLRALVLLDLHNNQIAAIPNDIAALENLSILNLSFNAIEILPDAVCSLPLVELHLAGNKLTALPDTLASLAPRLSILDVADNQIVAIPAGFYALSALQKCNLSKNQISGSIDPAGLGNLVHLTELNLANNAIESIGSVHESITMPALGLLDLKHNKLVQIDTRIACPALRDCCVSFNRITHIAEGSLIRCPKLEILDLRDNALVATPVDVLALKSLKRLDLTNNNITSFPPELGLLEELSLLLVSGNPARGLPSSGGTARLLEFLRKRIVLAPTGRPELVSIGASTVTISSTDSVFIDNAQSKNNVAVSSSLAIPAPSSQETASRTIDLSKRRIGTLTEDLVSAYAFAPTHLNLSHNQIHRIPEFIGQQVSSSLFALTARQNLISEFPNMAFPHLKNLDLSGNKLTTIPESLIELPNLDELNLSFNQIVRLPTRLPFPRLTVLLVSDNQLDSVDAQSLLDHVPLLQVLDLSNNAIARVPPELTLLSNLRNLQLMGNTFRVPRPAVLMKGTHAVIEYLRYSLPQP